MVVDSHHHFWDPSRRDYPWMGDELAAIRQRFGPEEFAPLLATAGVDRTIVVQTISSLDETREFLATANVTDFISGVVGWVDLTAPSVGETLAELRAVVGGNLLVGIRHQVHDEPDPRWLLRDDVRRGIAAVGEAGLVYDLLVKARELPAAVALVKEFPSMTFVLDHIGKPRIATGPRDEEWEKAMAPLARCPNVYCKLSGMVTEADWTNWSAADLMPYVSRVLDWYGPDRCMFGSDWPVCLLAADYQRVIDTLELTIEDLNPNARAGVLGQNAERAYGLST
ncbi:MAG TPA: amidohydrolase family protein [Candidatus Dormibacteraeota bacterium]|nr:amidohydrolase family protein [Candidatus Dormibacteraeota bacterium]